MKLIQKVVELANQIVDLQNKPEFRIQRQKLEKELEIYLEYADEENQVFWVLFNPVCSTNNYLRFEYKYQKFSDIGNYLGLRSVSVFLNVKENFEFDIELFLTILNEDVVKSFIGLRNLLEKEIDNLTADELIYEHEKRNAS